MNARQKTALGSGLAAIAGSGIALSAVLGSTSLARPWGFLLERKVVIKTIRVLLVILMLPLAYPASGHAESNAKEAHGVFTGEIKPVLYVSDVEASARFYREVLGFDFEGFAGSKANPYYAEMSVAGVKFGLHEPTSAGQETNVGNLRLYFRVKDLSAHRSRVLAWGIPAGEVKTTGWMNMFIVRDPDGNEVVFAVTDPDHHRINPWNTSEPVARGN